jgi:phospholipase C
MAALDQIDTIVVVMMENRSFDHLLGYLSLKQYGGLPLDGIRDVPGGGKQFANPGLPPDNFMYEPLPLHELHVADPPHERPDIAMQLGQPLDGLFPMKGFVRSAKGDAEVMQYYTSQIAPITDFFARNFRVCDRWFAPLPAGTQPNRLMAMSGYSEIEINVATPAEFPDQKLVYDWLNEKKVPWRVYHQGFFPFFSMSPRWMPEIALSDHFRRFDRLAIDFELESSENFPKVIFVEPKYTDSPHIGEGTDDHSPSSVLGGQRFLLDTYNALISNPRRWRKTVMLVTYDEHGGLFDHVQPLPITTRAPRGKYPDFISTGVRVPGLVISPLASRGMAFSKPLDHTSILKLLGQKFGGGKYSPEVDAREGVGSVLDALDLAAPLQAIPPAPSPARIPSADPFVRGFRPQTENVRMFQNAAHEMTRRYPHALATKFPEHRDFLGI